MILNLVFIRYWNRKLSKKSYNLDSERYMAKACAYLYRQCRFIDGFGEFGLTQRGSDSVCFRLSVAVQ